MSSFELKLSDRDFKTVVAHLDLALLTEEIQYTGDKTFLFVFNENGSFSYDYAKRLPFSNNTDYYRFQFGIAYLIGLFQMRYLGILTNTFNELQTAHATLQVKQAGIELLYNDLKSRVDPDILSEHIAGVGRTANKKKLH